MLRSSMGPGLHKFYTRWLEPRVVALFLETRPTITVHAVVRARNSLDSRSVSRWKPLGHIVDEARVAVDPSVATRSRAHVQYTCDVCKK